MRKDLVEAGSTSPMADGANLVEAGSRKGERHAFPSSEWEQPAGAGWGLRVGEASRARGGR